MTKRYVCDLIQTYFLYVTKKRKIVEYFNNYDNNILQRSKRGLKNYVCTSHKRD